MGFHHLTVHGNLAGCSCPQCKGQDFRRLHFWALRYSWAAAIRFLVCTVSLVTLTIVVLLPYLEGSSSASVIAEISANGYLDLLAIIPLCALISYVLIWTAVRNLYPLEQKIRAVYCTECGSPILLQMTKNQ